MSPRSIRRAAERRALKESRKTVPAVTNTPVNNDIVPQLSEARLAANRTNAQLSTGPKSDEGKAKVSLNAVKTALTGQTVLLPSDDVALYEALIQSFVDRHKPASDGERRLVQSLADTQWRLNRIPGLEAALFSRGRMEFAEKFAAHEPALAAALMDSETLVVYAKQLRNLHTQEGRLRRQYKQDLAALMVLLEERTQLAEAQHQCSSSVSPIVGFELTNSHESGRDHVFIAPQMHDLHWKSAA